MVQLKQQALRMKFILAKKNYIQKETPQNLQVIEEAANIGWQCRTRTLRGTISYGTTPYNTQMTWLLVRIARETYNDLDVLHRCFQTAAEYSVELGLDIFDALTGSFRNDTGCAAMAAGQPKIEVLLRERRQPEGGIIRATYLGRVERLTNTPEFYRRTEDAIKQVIENPPTTKFLTQKYNLMKPLSRNLRPFAAAIRAAIRA